jgi:hypothetical protein
MIKFKGRSVLKQYLPMKPIKRGYKLWCLADQRGYIKKFQIYQGKDEELNSKFTGYGLGEKVVLELTEQDWGKGKIVYFDNFFSSVALLEKLKTFPVFETIDLPRCSVQKNIICDYFILNKYNGLSVSCVYQLFRIDENFNLCGLCTPLPPDNVEVYYYFDIIFSVVMINDFLLDCQYCNNCGKNLFAVRVLKKI